MTVGQSRGSLEFLPLMMIDPPRDNFHIIFFISAGDAKTCTQEPAINHTARRNYLLCDIMCLLQSCFELLTNVIKIFSLWEIEVVSRYRQILLSLKYSRFYFIANRAISSKLAGLRSGLRAIHVRSLLNYSSVYAIPFAPLTKLTRFAINRVL